MSTIASVPVHGVVLDETNDTTKSTSDAPSDATDTSDSKPGQLDEPAMTEHVYKYKVQMTCGGCSGAITRMLTRAKELGAGINSFNVSLENQSVEVRGTITFDELTYRIQKTGKSIIEKEEVIETQDETSQETPEAPEVETTAQAVAVA